MFAVLAAVAAQAATALGWLGPPQPYDDRSTGTPEDALALIAALSVHDQSLTSMSWEQENHRASGGSWELVERSTRAWCEGRWSIEQKVFLPDDTGAAQVTSSRYVFDGQVLSALSRETGRCLVREARPADVSMWNSPLKLMGRFLDTSQNRTLSEILSGAQDLKTRPGEDGRTSIVSGYVEVNGHAWYLEVGVALDAGFAPRSIAIFDGLLRWPIERSAVEKFEQHAGVWIPVVATDEFWNLPTEINDPKWDEFQKKVLPLVKAGPPNPADPTVRQAYKEAIAACYGPGGITVEPMAPCHRLTVSHVEVNRPPAPGVFEVNAPEGTVFVNFLQLHATDGKPVAIGP